MDCDDESAEQARYQGISDCSWRGLAVSGGSGLMSLSPQGEVGKDGCLPQKRVGLV